MTPKIDSSSSAAARSVAALSTVSPQVASATASAAGPGAVDKVSLSGDAVRMQQIDKAVAEDSSSGIDAKRVAETRAAISSGRYTINSSRIADKLARLEGSLAGK